MSEHNFRRKNYRKKLQEFIDDDYYDTLSEEDQQWITKFNLEYYSNNRPRKDKSDEDYLHSKSHIKELDDANNARNRDLYARKNVTNGLANLDDLKEQLKNERHYTNLMETLYKKYDEHTAVRKLFEIIRDNIIENPSQFNIEHNLCRLIVEYNKFQKNKRNYRKN